MTKSTGIRLKGIWRCSHCGNLESQEREVMCWECGKGEMLFYSADDLCQIFNSANVLLFPKRSEPASVSGSPSPAPTTQEVSDE